MEEMIVVRNVTKRYGTAEVLKHVDLTIRKGSIHGLVGRNGSGKTMLLKAICGIVPVTEGEIVWEGKVIGKEVEKPENMGALIEGPGFLEDYSGIWNLRFLKELTGKADVEHLKTVLQTVGLDPDAKKKVGKYSMGMKQRLGIAQAIMDGPQLLLLDEPMNGLDNADVQEMRLLFRRLNEENKTTIVIASHMEEDIRFLCHEVAHMDDGAIISREVIREVAEA